MARQQANGGPTVNPTQLRARFAERLSDLYGREVPAYTTLLDVAREVNLDVARRNPARVEEFGSLDRVTAERHGAIRVGTTTELRQASRIFAALGMYPVGFYDLRDAAPTPVPVVSTAFRPVAAAELQVNPFRVFTSVLVAEDRRFFTADRQRQIEDFLSHRQLFGDELLGLAESAIVDQGLAPAAAERFLHLASQAFALSPEPVDGAWYRSLEQVSSVAADIAGLASTHINHLTPRVLDIDELSRRMTDRGIEMIPEIQGPPSWDGPPVLLRQTSFRALAEARLMREPDGTVQAHELRTRFGEVEARGVALTPSGRDLVDELAVTSGEQLAQLGPSASAEQRRAVTARLWTDRFPSTHTELAAVGYAHYRYFAVAGMAPPSPGTARADLIRGGWLAVEPIVYEDFLPRSAAGIFQSNLTSGGAGDQQQAGVERDIDWLRTVLGVPVYNPDDLYYEQSNDSYESATAALTGR